MATGCGNRVPFVMLYLAFCTENEVECDKTWIMGMGFLLGLVDAAAAGVRQLRDERGVDYWNTRSGLRFSRCRPRQQRSRLCLSRSDKASRHPWRTAIHSCNPDLLLGHIQVFQGTIRQVLSQEEVEAGVHFGCGFVADEDGPVELLQDATDLGSGVPIMGTVS